MKQLKAPFCFLADELARDNYPPELSEVNFCPPDCPRRSRLVHGARGGPGLNLLVFLVQTSSNQEDKDQLQPVGGQLTGKTSFQDAGVPPGSSEPQFSSICEQREWRCCTHTHILTHNLYVYLECVTRLVKVISSSDRQP